MIYLLLLNFIFHWLLITYNEITITLKLKHLFPFILSTFLSSPSSKQLLSCVSSRTHPKKAKISLFSYLQHLSIFSIFRIAGVMRFIKNASKKSLRRYGKKTCSIQRERTQKDVSPFSLKKVAVESKKDEKNN